MKNAIILTSAKRFELILTATAQSARNENKIGDVIDSIPNIVNHIMWNSQTGVFTPEETLKLIFHLLSLKEELS